MKTTLLLAALISSSLIAGVERIYHPAVYSKSDIGLAERHPIDTGKWLWHPDYESTGEVCPEGMFMRFRLEFDAIPGEVLVFDVCADERYVLRLDGKVISRGPNRGSIENWQFQSYKVDLPAGKHVFDALVWRLGENAPIAQTSWKGGFVLKAEGAYHKTVSTGYFAPWKVGRVTGTSPREPNKVKLDAFGVGCVFNVKGTRADFEEPPYWAGTITNTAWVLNRLWKGHGATGTRYNGWQLFPSDMPEQTENAISPGAFKAARQGAFSDNVPYTASDASNPLVAAFNDLLKKGRKIVVPPNTAFSAIWHLGKYQTGYPEMKTSKGKGSEIRWGWAESMSRKLPDGSFRKGDRSAFDGLLFNGMEDAFFPDGRMEADFSIPWWRSGLWCRIDVKTADESLEITGIGITESRYPLEDEGYFDSDDASLAEIRKISLRALQMCCHETTMDCPYYEQQQYPGDSCPELLAMRAFTSDDRLVRRVVESFDYARHPDGFVPFVSPVRRKLDCPTYTMCHMIIQGDYSNWYTNRQWLERRMPGARHAADAFEQYENEDGLLVGLPGWCFMDWCNEWKESDRGCAPDGKWVSKRPSSVNNLLYLLALKKLAEAETALGEDERAAFLKRKADRLADAIRRKFWSEKRGMIADTVDLDCFSEHAQALALLSDALPPAMAARSMENLATADDLARCTVYFSSFLFEAYFKYSRADLFLKRMNLWRRFLKLNLTTLLESPGDSARSDCHAWGAHPAYFFATGLAGITPDAPFFGRVKIAPCPGSLKRIKTLCPHPKGSIALELDFSSGSPRGVVTTPVPGVFEWKGTRKNLSPGRNMID